MRRCILTITSPVAEGTLGQPPFETPSIHRAVTNFVLSKFSHLTQQECHNMYELATIFLQLLNTWEVPSPSNTKHAMTPEELSQYKMAYNRWLVFCHVPTYCDSFRRYDTSVIFGRQFLRAFYKYVRKEIIDQFHQQRVRVPIERRVMILTHFPPFLDQLDEEIFAPNSVIWNPDFKQLHLPQLQGSMLFRINP